VHHDELTARVLDLMAQHPAWSLPLGYKDGVFGAERVPSGAYLGDRDMFLFLVDGNRDLDEAYTFAETFESNPRSVWGYVQGLTRLSQRTPWQDGRFALDRAASRLLTTVH
jgi:hypothetical protein